MTATGEIATPTLARPRRYLCPDSCARYATQA